MTRPAPDDLIKVADDCCGLLGPVADRDWEVRAGDLDWSCRRTLEHLASLAFAPQLAMRATTFRPLAFRIAADAPVEQLLWTAQTMSHILADVARAARPEDRAFHPAGMADPAGWLAMGMDELLVHTHDICLGLQIDFVPDDLAARMVLDRLFPWWPRQAAPAQALLWANGRASLPGLEDIGDTWRWHCAPLSEWTGTIRTRHGNCHSR